MGRNRLAAAAVVGALGIASLGMAAASAARERSAGTATAPTAVIAEVEEPRLEVFDNPEEVNVPVIGVTATLSADGEYLTYLIELDNQYHAPCNHPVRVDVSGALDDATWVPDAAGNALHVLRAVAGEVTESSLRPEQLVASDGTLELVPGLEPGETVVVTFVLRRAPGGGDGTSEVRVWFDDEPSIVAMAPLRFSHRHQIAWDGSGEHREYDPTVRPEAAARLPEAVASGATP